MSVEIGKARAGTFADVDERKDVEDMRIAGVTGSALDGHGLVHPKNARIGEADRLRLFLYDDAAASMVVGMDERICQQLAKRFVDFVLLDAQPLGIQLERHFDMRSYAIVDHHVEVVDVAAPSRVVRGNTVRPARVGGKFLAVVQKEIRKDVHDLSELREADKSGKIGMHLAVFAAPGRTDSHKELLVGQVIPDMLWLLGLESVAIAANGLRAQIVNRQLFKQACVCGFNAGVPHHRLDRLARTVVVAFAIAPEGSAEHVLADINRTILSIRPRDFYHDNIAASAFHGIDMTIEKNVDADLLAVVDAVPKTLDQRRRLRHARN